MTFLQYVLLGIVQGLTEFLPISSSAHQLLISRLLNWPDPGAAFTAVTQFGTEAAVLYFFRADLVRLTKTLVASIFRRKSVIASEARFAWYLLLGSLPIGILGIALKDYIVGSARDLRLVGANLVLFGLLLGWLDRTARSNRGEADLSAARATVFGLGQALALLPGVSRSGATISAGRLMGFNRAFAAKYSFLLAIPAVLASAAFEALDIPNQQHVDWVGTAVATAIAFFVALGVIRWLMHWLSERSFAPFVWYRVVLGATVLILVASGLVSPR